MNLTLTATILYIVVVLGIGFVASRKKGGAQEYFLAGRQLAWPLLLPLLAAEYINGSSTVGIVEKLHMTGISGLAYYIASPIGLIILAYGFAKFYQHFDALPEERKDEEERVHRLTRELLSRHDIEGLATVMNFYAKWQEEAQIV